MAFIFLHFLLLETQKYHLYFPSVESNEHLDAWKSTAV